VREQPRERSRVAETPIPEAWIGDDIVVLVGEGLEALDGPLLEVNERGVVIDNLLNLEELEERHAAGETRVALKEGMKFVDMFIPWHRISGISKPRTEERGAGPEGQA
jgi:hypothetical protein